MKDEEKEALTIKIARQVLQRGEPAQRTGLATQTKSAYAD